MKRLLLTSVLVLLPSCQEKIETKKIADFQDFIKNFGASNTTIAIPDLSTAHFSSELEHIRGLLTALTAIDTTTLSFEDRIDWRFAHSILKGPR